MNHKIAIGLLGLGLAAGAGTIAGFRPSAPAAAATATAAADTETVTFYGTMERNTSWTQTQNVGFYSFTDSGEPDEFTMLTSQTNKMVTGGGAYYDGYFYYVNGVETSIPEKISNTFNKVDVETWETVGASGHTYPTLTDSYALAYDYSTSTMYAYCPDRTSDGYYLRTVDLKTGEFTDVAKVDASLYIPAIAFSADGVMYGVAHDPSQRSSKLYKIDKTNGKTTLVGDIGYMVNCDYAGAVFDYRTGKLYWSSMCYTVNQYQERTYTSYLMEIDTTTGKATPVKTFKNGEVFSTLFLKDCHPKAPEAVDGLAVRYASGSDNNVTIDFTLPSRRYDRSSLPGALKVEVYVDGKLSQTLTNLSAGAKSATNAITIADGSHKAVFYCYDSNGRKSVAAEISVWGGRDVAGKVENVSVSVTPRGDVATLSWSAPSGSKSGGNYDAAGVTYKVIRRPDGVTIADGLTSTTLTDTPARKMLLSQYEIYAVTSDGESDPYYTTPMLIGAAVEPPYLETFDTAQGFNTFTIIDTNGVGHYEGDRWMWYGNNREAIYWLDYAYYNAADAWLITPTINLNADDVYRLSFSTRGYATGDFFEFTLSAHVGDLPTVAGQKREIMRVVNKHSKEYVNYHGFFTAEKGDCRVGFHLVSPGTDHRGLDNIRVAYYGPSTIPAAPSVVSTGMTDGAVNIRVKAPSTDTKGRTIKTLTNLRLYRSGSSMPIATLTDGVSPGATVVISDTEPVFGDNDYVITATNGDGQGLEAEVTVNTKSPAPVAVDEVNVRTTNSGRDVVVSWTYPEGYPSKTGEKLDPSEITYNVYRKIDGNLVAVAQNIPDNSFTDKLVSDLFTDQQKYVDYSVEASTTGGTADRVDARVIVGRPYELPIAESNFYDMTTSPWQSSPVTAWAPGTNGYEPRATPFTGSSMMRCYGSGNTQTWTSPRLNLSSLTGQKLTFRMFCQNSDLAAGSTLEIGLVCDEDGVEQPMKIISETFSCKGTDGWNLFEVDLSDYSRYNRASIVFVAHAGRNYMIYLDDIQVTGDLLANDLALKSLTGPSQVVRGRENVYTAVVANNGTNAMSGTVRFECDGEVLKSETINLGVDESASVDCEWTPDLNGALGTSEITATVSADNDLNPYNDAAMLQIEYIYPNVPYVNDLTAQPTADRKAVRLSWSEARVYPGAVPVKDDFESYDDFTISDFGEWTMVDKDGAATVGGMTNSVASYTWENCGEPQAYIVFNASKVGVADVAAPYSGKKCLVSFTAATQNDDWLISPRLLGMEQTISLQARAMMAYYTPETYEVWVSSTGNEPDDFTLLKSESLRNDSWSRKTYDLPDGTRYFAIRCTSKGMFGLMLDDIEYIPAQPAVNLNGYNVYRNGDNIADCIGETEYTDTDVDPAADYTYHVSAVYDDGESIFSNAATINLSAIAAVGAETVTVTAFDGRIRITGATGLVGIFAIDGRMLYNFRSSGNDSVEVTPGIYIVAVGGRTFKLIVK